MPKLLETYDEAIRLADAARRRAVSRREDIRAQVLNQVRRGVRHTGTTPIKVIVDRWASVDPVWTSAVKDNQWYLAQAAAFAAGSTGEVLGTIMNQQITIIELLKEIRDDRRAAPASGLTEYVEPSV